MNRLLTSADCFDVNKMIKPVPLPVEDWNKIWWYTISEFSLTITDIY
jgi:hypothetical protein